MTWLLAWLDRGYTRYWRWRYPRVHRPSRWPVASMPQAVTVLCLCNAAGVCLHEVSTLPSQVPATFHYGGLAYHLVLTEPSGVRLYRVA